MYKNEALFSDTKIVTSVYEKSFDETLDVEMINKLIFDGIDKSAIQELENPNYENIMMATINHSDAIIVGSQNLNPTLTKYIENSKKPFLPFAPQDNFADAYTNFYKNEVL